MIDFNVIGLSRLLFDINFAMGVATGITMEFQMAATAVSGHDRGSGAELS